MIIEIKQLKSIESSLLIVPVFEGEKTISIPGQKRLEKVVSGLLKYSGISGKFLESMFGVTEMEQPRFIMLIGLGRKDESSHNDLRKAMSAAARICMRKDIESYGILLRGGGDEEKLASVCVEGIIWGAYSFTEFKTGEEEKLPRKGVGAIHFYGTKTKKPKEIIKHASKSAKIADIVNKYRDVINAPANYMTPRKLAEVASEMAKKNGLNCKVYGLDDIKKMGMGGLVAISQGSVEPPQFIFIEYMPERSRKTIVLVGKGVTFDSGGISIKQWEGMDKMKFDMAGAGAVIGTLDVISQLRPKVRVIGLVPVTESLPSGSAYKPGDILKMHCGKTVEIISTDAEGRLILADALSFAKKFKPDVIIDIATLTGACVIALGHEASGLMGNNRKLINAIRSAGEEGGERTWELPLWKEYEELIKSENADMKNVGGRAAGAIAGGIFLKSFVEDTPWAHIDIAGTAWVEEKRPDAPTGATGVGIRLLVRLIESM